MYSILFALFCFCDTSGNLLPYTRETQLHKSLYQQSQSTNCIHSQKLLHSYFINLCWDNRWSIIQILNSNDKINPISQYWCCIVCDTFIFQCINVNQPPVSWYGDCFIFVQVICFYTSNFISNNFSVIPNSEENVFTCFWYF